MSWRFVVFWLLSPGSVTRHHSARCVIRICWGEIVFVFLWLTVVCLVKQVSEIEAPLH